MRAKSILLVEDSPDDAALAEAAFRQLGYGAQLEIAEDGETALTQVLGRAGERIEPSQLPAFVLLDLKLPGIDGFEVLRRIRADALAVTVPVVVLTSSLETSDMWQSYRLGANSYVRKPIEYKDFVALADQLARYWLTLNRTPLSEGSR